MKLRSQFTSHDDCPLIMKNCGYPIKSHYRFLLCFGLITVLFPSFIFTYQIKYVYCLSPTKDRLARLLEWDAFVI